MKKTMTAIALISATAFTAPALADTAKLEIEVGRFVADADLSKVDVAGILQLESIVYGSGGSMSDKKAQIVSILEDNNAYTTAEPMIYGMSQDDFAKLEIELARFGDYDLSTLTSDEIATLRSFIYSSDSMGEKSSKIAALFS